MEDANGTADRGSRGRKEEYIGHQPDAHTLHLSLLLGSANSA